MPVDQVATQRPILAVVPSQYVAERRSLPSGCSPKRFRVRMAGGAGNPRRVACASVKLIWRNLQT